MEFFENWSFLEIIILISILITPVGYLIKYILSWVYMKLFRYTEFDDDDEK